MPALTPEDTRMDCALAIALGRPCPDGLDGWGQQLYKIMLKAHKERKAKRARADARAIAKRATLRPRA